MAKKGDDASLDAIKGMRCRKTGESILEGLFGAAGDFFGLEDLQTNFNSKRGQTS